MISDNIGAGVSFGLGATNNVAQGNVISGNIGAGVYFGLGATNNVVQGNVISGNIGAAVSGPGAANNMVQGNVISGNGEPSLPPSNNPQPSILLVPAQNSSLPLIATLLVTSLTGGESQNMSTGFGTASVAPNQAIAPSGKGGEGAHAADESGNPQGGLSRLIPPPLRPWVLVLLGTNEALARIRGAIPDLFTFGDGQHDPVELLSRAYQAVVRTIDEAIPFLASRGDLIPIAALPVPTVAWDIDEVASDLALEEPLQPQATPSAASAAADAVRHPGEVLARAKKSWRVGLVGGFIAGSMIITANAVKRTFQRHRRRKNRLVPASSVPKPAQCADLIPRKPEVSHDNQSDGFYFYCNRFTGGVRCDSKPLVIGAAGTSLWPQTSGRSAPPRYAATRA